MQKECADSSRAPGLTFGLQGSVNGHRGALLFVPQWQCIGSFVFYMLFSLNYFVTFLLSASIQISSFLFHLLRTNTFQFGIKFYSFWFFFRPFDKGSNMCKLDKWTCALFVHLSKRQKVSIRSNAYYIKYLIYWLSRFSYCTNILRQEYWFIRTRNGFIGKEFKKKKQDI